MPFFDLDNLIKAAVAILQGSDPYLLPDVYYPLPLYLIFIPLAGLPLPVAHGIWLAIELAILVAILRRRAFVAVFFMPVFLTLLMGQIVMPMLGLFALLRTGLFGGVALGLLALKPQLVLFIAPWMLWRWWQRERKQIIWFALTLAILATIAFLIQPDWLARWLAVSGRRLRAPIAPSVWGVLSFLPTPAWIALAGLATVAIFVWAWRKNDFDLISTAGLLVNPLIISYDQTLLTTIIRDSRLWVVLTGVSWIAFGVSAAGLVSGEGPSAMTTLAVLIMLALQRRAQTRDARAQ